jgi:hypothetical protein
MDELSQEADLGETSPQRILPGGPSAPKVQRARSRVEGVFSLRDGQIELCQEPVHPKGRSHVHDLHGQGHAASERFQWSEQVPDQILLGRLTQIGKDGPSTRKSTVPSSGTL